MSDTQTAEHANNQNHEHVHHEGAEHTTHEGEHAEHAHKEPGNADALKTIPPTNTVKFEKKFGFRKIKDELGQESKRASLLLSYPVPSFDGLVNAMTQEGDAGIKVQEYVLGLIVDQINAGVRAQIDDEDEWKKAGEQLDFSKLDVNFLANQPSSDRRGGGIAKEVWDSFGKDYLEVMVPATGKDAEKVGKAAQLFVAKLQPVKSNKKVLAFLKDMLELYTVSTKEAEQFEDVIEFLGNKIKTFLMADDSDLLNNL
jgi:hypothetical protein